jgi:hypothetical protein
MDFLFIVDLVPLVLTHVPPFPKRDITAALLHIGILSLDHRAAASRKYCGHLSIGWRAMPILTTLTLKHAHIMSLEGKYMTPGSVSFLR